MASAASHDVISSISCVNNSGSSYWQQGARDDLSTPSNGPAYTTYHYPSSEPTAVQRSMTNTVQIPVNNINFVTARTIDSSSSKDCIKVEKCNDVSIAMSSSSRSQDTYPRSKTKGTVRSISPQYNSSGPKRQKLNSDKMTLKQAANLSTLNLIRLFSVSEDDEVRRKYYFSCHFLPSSCSYQVSSFGSEHTARTKIGRHLHDHVKTLLVLNEREYSLTPPVMCNVCNALDKGTEGLML